MERPSSIAAGRLAESLEPEVSIRDRFGLGARLTAALTGVGLLVVAAAHSRLVPDQPTITSLLLGLAAAVVATPVLFVAARGFAARPPRAHPEQLVALALLAAFARGDFLTAALVPLLMDLAHFVEERCVAGTQAAIDRIRALQAREATVLRGGREVRVRPEELSPGETLLVRPGETIAADGRVTAGTSCVNAAPVTGESSHVDVEPGAPVFAGTVNLSGLLEVVVGSVGASTALGKVVALLAEAERSRPPVTRVLERHAEHYLAVVVGFAAIVLLLTGDLPRSIAVLVVACPCAFVLSSPTAMVAALAASSRLEILIKNTRFLEAVADVDTLILDKTGTVTFGRLEVVGLEPHAGETEDGLLSAAACAGTGSLHPAARAAVDAARARGLAIARPERVVETPGRGICAVTETTTWRMGRRAWLAEHGVPVGTAPDGGGTGIWLARDTEPVGVIRLADRPRPEAGRALRACRNLGIERLVLLTGDREEAARRVAEEAGIDSWVADVLPEQKLEVVRRHQASGRKVMFVGDGVNDALALAGADVGVAVGARASGVALDSADVAILDQDLAGVPTVIRLSRATRRTIAVNILVGAGFSATMLGLAAFGVIGAVTGAVLHNGGAVFVILNSARLLGFEKHSRAGRRSESVGTGDEPDLQTAPAVKSACGHAGPKACR